MIFYPKMKTSLIVALSLLSGWFFASTAGQAESRAEMRADIRDKVFLSVQNGLNSTAGQAMVQAGARIAAGSEALASLLRQRQDIIDGLKPLSAELSVALQAKGVESEQQAAQIEQKIQTARAGIIVLDQRLEQEFPEFKELINPSAVPRAEVQALLQDDEALILTLTDHEHIYVWAISKTKADWHRAKLGRASLEQRIKLLRSYLSGAGDTRSAAALDDDFVASVAPFDRAAAYDLYNQLLAPLADVFGQARHLMSVVDGPLTSLPLSVLVTRPPEGSDSNAEDLQQTAWMIRAHALTTLPSVSSLRILRRSHTKPQINGKAVPFIGFGDPLLGYRLTGDRNDETPTENTAPSHTRGVYDAVSKVADLAPLPNTAKELQALAKVMGSGSQSVILGLKATETAVKSADLSQVKVLAFATHGLLANGLPGLNEPALVFTPPDKPNAEDDALLTASEAAQLKLSADLIILSACDTAGGDGTPGADGLSGLARAFIYAGARAILVSHWPVDDYAASVLTTGMLRQMFADDPKSRAEALQFSMLALLDRPGSTAYAHPSIWAPFVIVGEGGLD